LNDADIGFDDQKKSLLVSDSLPETVFEEDEFSDPEESKLDSDLPMVMESDDILDDASSRLNESRANDSMLGASFL
jgi:hypothetical protein